MKCAQLLPKGVLSIQGIPQCFGRNFAAADFHDIKASHGPQPQFSRQWEAVKIEGHHETGASWSYQWRVGLAGGLL